MADLVAKANLRGRRIDLDVHWVGPELQPGLIVPTEPPFPAPPGARASFRVVRRRTAFPTSPDDGLVLFDFVDLFEGAGVPWAKLERRRWLVTNALREGGLVQAELILCTKSAAAEPSRAVIRIREPGAAKDRTFEFESVSRVSENEGVIDIFGEGAGGAEVLLGKWTVAEGHVIWAPNGGVFEADFDVEERHATVSVVRSPIAPFSVVFTTSSGANVIRVIEFEEAQNPDTGEVARSMKVSDAEPSGLKPATTYYYAVFSSLPDGSFVPSPALTASAVATGNFGFGDRLYELVPGVHRLYDEPVDAPSQPGQLRRFLQTVGAGMDAAFTLGEGLPSLHDVYEVDAKFLPNLARWIGWEPDRTLPDQLKRTDILFAPEVFGTVGTIPNVTALINRGTGWTCEVKEFVDNVFLTNAVESVHLWQIHRVVGAAVEPEPRLYPSGTPGAVLAQNDPKAFDGRPAGVRVANGGAVLFWHSHRAKASRAARRRIWMQSLSEGSVAKDALEDQVDQPEFVDEDPAALFDGTRVWLFWSSNRHGSFDILARSFDAAGANPGPILRLTDHELADRRPACVFAEGAYWVFFESSRRGPIDIWFTRSADGIAWDVPRRVTSGNQRDRSPSAVVDSANVLRLYWSAEQGDHSRIMESTRTADGWSTPVEVIVNPALVRDEAPAAVLFAGTVRLYWHSNRVVDASGRIESGSRWRIWTSTNTGVATWSKPTLVVTRLSTDKEPSAILSPAGDGVVVYMRSLQTGERFRSCTVDTATDAGKLAIQSMGSRVDRMHYTYDTARKKEDWYARDAVGLYLTPTGPESSPGEHARTVARVRGFVASFRPVPVRFIWFIKQPTPAEKFDPVEADG